MSQKSLFDFTPQPTDIYGYPISERQQLARRTDPATSHQASKKTVAELGGYHLIFYNALQKIGHEATAQEVAAAAVPLDGSMPVAAGFSKRESIRKRAKELVSRGVISVTGSRICRVTGNESSTYEVIREGRANV